MTDLLRYAFSPYTAIIMMSTVKLRNTVVPKLEEYHSCHSSVADLHTFEFQHGYAPPGL